MLINVINLVMCAVLFALCIYVAMLVGELKASLKRWEEEDKKP